MPSDRQATALVERHATLKTAVRAALVEFLRALWASLGSYDRADITRFAAAAVPVVQGAQVQAAALTDSYLALLEQTVTSVPTRPVGIPRAIAIDSRGVPALDVYRRPGPDIWGALKNGVDYQEAVGRGLTRAVGLAETDVQLAETHAARHVLAGKPKVVGYRRVLTGAESCGLCAVASTQRYHRANLLPIHPGCDCQVSPIYGDVDPGRVINQRLVDDLGAEVTDRFGATTRRSYSDLVVVHEHGEVGPMLTRKGDVFTSAQDV